MTHYSRLEWGARDANAKYLLDPNRVIGVALHWPGTTLPLKTPNAVMSAIRSWQRMHMDVNGWSDIAYQIAVDQAGNTYRLRGLRYRSGANGDTDTNERYGAFLLVLAQGEKPTDELIRAVQARVTAHRRIFTRSRLIVGHGQIRPEPTACPGPAVLKLISDGAFTPKKKG